MNRLRQHFFTGIAVVLPLALTLLLFMYIWNLADAFVVNPLYEALPYQMDKRIAILLIKCLILLLVIAMICLVGFLANNYVIKQLIRVGEEVLAKVPMVNRVYSIIKEISNSFFGKNSQKDLFRSAVLIQYPRQGLYSVAFITKTAHPAMDEKTGKSVVSVFIPTTPNPTSGVLLFVPKEDLTDLPLTVEEAIKLVISAGALTGENGDRKGRSKPLSVDDVKKIKDS